MIAYDLSSEAQRTRISFYNLFSTAGKVHLAKLLEEEKKVLRNFVMSYETPQLRRLEAKARRQELSEEEQELLRKGKKSFQGVLASGGMLEDKAAVELVNKYLSVEDIIEDDLKILDKYTNEGDDTKSSEVLLGRPISYWNLHPNQFSEEVYHSLFDSPEYVKSELNKLFLLKVKAELDIEPEKVFTNRNEVDTLLLDYNANEEEKSILTQKLLDLQVVGDVHPSDFKYSLIRLIKLLMEKDREFDYSIYKDVKNILPQYHNKKTKYFIYILSQFNHTGTIPVSSRIDLTTIQAFYRKADELCYS